VNLREIEEQQENIRGELRRIEQNDESDPESDGDMVDTLVDRYEVLERRRVPLAERAAKLDIIRVAAKDEDATEPGDTRDTRDSSTSRSYSPLAVPTQVYRNKRDPFEDLDAVRHRLIPKSELRARALDAIERSERHGDLVHDHAEAATLKAQDSPGIARHLLMTGSDEYREAFRAYMEDPEGNVQRAAMSLTNANGGYLLPFVLDPTIVLTNAGSANPWRRIANVKSTTSNTWNGVTSAGVNAGWLAEGAAASDNSPTVGNIQITPLKAAAWVFGSYEVLADTNFGEQLPMLLGDAKDRLEEAAFATGTGTAQPKGIITAATTTVSTATTGAYVVADVYALQAAVPARFRQSSSVAWVMNLAIINKTRAFDTAGGSSFWAHLGTDSPDLLLGKPLYESTTMSGVLTTTNKIAVFGDFSQYYIVDRVGVSLIYQPMVTGTGASANLPTGQSGWFMFWRVGADAAVPGAFRVLLT
jgi:HK97 family phage major capsid protein